MTRKSLALERFSLCGTLAMVNNNEYANNRPPLSANSHATPVDTLARADHGVGGLPVLDFAVGNGAVQNLLARCQWR